MNLTEKKNKIKLLKANGGGKKLTDLIKYKAENEKKIEREELKDEVKREIMKNNEEKEETRKRIWREEREMQNYYSTKRYRYDDDY